MIAALQRRGAFASRPASGRVRALAWIVAVACTIDGAFAPSAAHAQSAPAAVTVEVAPIFGEGCVPRGPQTEFVVTVINGGGRRVTGTARVESSVPSVAAGQRTVPQVPFAIAPRGRVTLRVPLSTPSAYGVDAILRIDDDAARPLAMQMLHYENPADGMLIDATPQGRLAATIRSGAATDPFAPPSPARTPGTPVTACPAQRLGATGEVVLPRTLEGYNGVSTVVVDAGTVMSLPLNERVVLADWVNAGGSLVIVPSRADELRHPTLEAFVGRGIRGVRAPALNPSDPTVMAMSIAVPGTIPRVATLENAESYEGGNLHTRTLAGLLPWGAANLLGATAEYGFGHVHVLSFNPTMPPGLDDPWSLTFMQSLARQSTAGATAQHPLADSPTSHLVPSAVRRALDPNEGFRSGLGLAVLLLAVYAVFAGPVSFRLAARRGRPLRALARLPLYSLVFFAAIVALGGVSRGWQGRARRLTLIELPAGMARGEMRRYHGYFSGNGGRLSVRARGIGRRLYADPSEGNGDVALHLERDGAALQGLNITPWSLAVVREQGFETMAGAVTLQPDFAGRVRVVNRLSHALRNVLVLLPSAGMGWALREIPAGQTRMASTGTPIPNDVLTQISMGVALPSTVGPLGRTPSFTSRRYYAPPTPTTPPTPTVGIDSTGSATPGAQIAALFGADTRVANEWNAVFETAPGFAGGASDGPVLIAQIDAPLPAEEDGGLRVERDGTFVRVVGWGGAP